MESQNEGLVVASVNHAQNQPKRFNSSLKLVTLPGYVLCMIAGLDVWTWTCVGTTEMVLTPVYLLL